MDIGTAGALSLFNYQTSLKAAGAASGAQATARNEAVVQALSSAYGNVAGGLDGTSSSPSDLSALAGSSILAPLAGSLYSATLANGGTSLPFGNAASPATDLAGLGGFTSASLGLNATLALAAYSAGQSQGAGSPADSGSASPVQQAVQSAQAALFTNTLNLLG